MNEVVIKKLERLFMILKENDLPVAKFLQPPYAKEKIESLIKEFPFKIHEDLFTLYQWKNGANDSFEGYLGAYWLFPGAGFPSLDRAVEIYQEFAGNDEFWTESKFLVFESGGGDMLVMECDPCSKEYGMILEYDLGAVDYEVMITKYDSLSSLLDSVIECFNQKLYICDPVRGVNGINHETRLKEIEIQKEKNPNSSYWQLV